MNTLDVISLSVLAIFTVIFAIKGLKKIVLTIISIAIATLLSRLFGNQFGELIVPRVIKNINTNLGDEALDSISDTLTSTVGVIIVFIICFLIIRLLFKIVELNSYSSMRTNVINHILGACVGFVIGIGFIFAFSSVLYTVETVAVAIDPSNSLPNTVDNAKIINIIRNLN